MGWHRPAKGGRFGRTGEAIVVLVCEFVVNEDGVSVVLGLQTLLHAGDLVVGDLETRPAVPLEAGGFRQTAEAGDEATRGHGEGIAAIIGTLNGDGQSVGEEQEAPGRGLFVDERRHLGVVSQRCWYWWWRRRCEIFRGGLVRRVGIGEQQELSLVVLWWEGKVLAESGWDELAGVMEG